MRKAIGKKFVCLFSALGVASAALAAAITINAGGAKVSAEGEENVLYSQDFSSAPEAELSEYVAVSDGAATLTTSQTFTLPIAQMAASNNYEVSFDMKLLDTSDLFVHYVGLNGTTGEDLYLKETGSGAYWAIEDFNGHSVYNNSGDLHGGLDGNGVDLSEFVSVKYVHYEGYMELWLNGTRRCVSHLSNFGNNNYVTRAALEEGTITGIAFRAGVANAVAVDNVKVKEAVGGETSYRAKNASQSVSSQEVFPLSAENLYRDNFKVTGTFRLANTDGKDFYPTIKLFGLNASLVSNNKREYAVNIQSLATGGTFSPQVFWQIEGADPWAGRTGENVDFAAGDDIEYRIEVYGDHLDFYMNGTLAVGTTFTEMGIQKGHLQYIRIVSGNGGAYWTDFTYDGYESQTAAEISASATRLKAGETLTVTADVFGQKGETFTWYVNGAANSETGTTLTLEDLEAGTYTIQYKGTTTVSNEIEVKVTDKLLTIAADKNSLYPTEEVTVTATLDGDFTGETPVWYVNGVAQSETGATLVLSGLEAGTYKVHYQSANVKSNEITITVKKSEITVSTEKNSYFTNEKATFTATLTGLADTETLSWFINGERVENATGATLEVDLKDYAAGTQLLVLCKSASGVESGEVTISVVYDVMASIKGDENFKSIYEDKIEAGKTYGNFSVGQDEDGSYLFSEVGSDSTWYTMNGKIPASTGFIMEYKLYIPADISATYFVYPCMAGLNSKFPDKMMETAFNVNKDGVSPYLKDQGSGVSYDAEHYGFGKDLSYEGDIAKKGGWNTIAVAVEGKYITMYLNGEIVLFINLPTATIPSGYAFNFYPDGGTGVVPLKIKDIVLSGIVEPAPDLKSVSLSVSTVNVDVNQTVTVTAALNPYNAEFTSVTWYVNDAAVEGTGLTYTFSAAAAGTYKIHCVVDGITSSSKTITVSAGSSSGDDGKTSGCKSGCKSGIAGAGLSALGGAAVLIALLKKKKY